MRLLALDNALLAACVIAAVVVVWWGIKIVAT
jgi:hypothetical protein